MTYISLFIFLVLTSTVTSCSKIEKSSSRTSIPWTKDPTVDDQNPEKQLDESPEAPKMIDLDPVIFAEGLEIEALAFTNSGLPAVECRISPALPDGMSIEEVNGTCKIVGQPTESKAQTTYTVTAKAADQSSDTATVTITVRVGIPPVLADVPSPITFEASKPIVTLDFANTGDNVVTCSIHPSLPAGLSISVHNGSCRISGTATEARTATDYAVTATAIDGSKDTTTINLAVYVPNPPIITDKGSHTFTVGIPISPITFNNTGAAIANCSVEPALPDGLTINTSNCEISGTPTQSSVVTTYNITATAEDNSFDTASLSITVNVPNPPDLANAGTKNFVATLPISTFNFTNTGGEVVSCSVSPDLPSGFNFNTTSCEISGTPAASSNATYTATATAADGTTDTATVTIIVAAANPPILVDQGSKYFITTVSITAFDFENSGAEIQNCAISPELSAGLSFNTSTCEISGTPSASQSARLHTVTATAADGTTDTATVSITVASANPPIFADAGTKNFVATLAITSFNFTNTGAEVASCSISPPLPEGLSINASTCEISGTPTASSSAAYTVTASAADGSTDTATVTINVAASNPPILADQGTKSLVNTLAIASFDFDNAGAAIQSCIISPTLSAGLSFNTSTCEISGTPTTTQTLRLHTVTATAADGTMDTATVSVEVVAANPPILADAEAKNFVATVAIDSFNFTNTGAAIVSCSISPSLPFGLSLNTSSCQISGTPATSSSLATYTVTAAAADTTTDSATVAITIAAANPPVLANISDVQTLTEGNEADPVIKFVNSGSAVKTGGCSISPSLPDGLSLAVDTISSPATCKISGTPSLPQDETTYTVTAMATDGSTDTATVKIAVVADKLTCPTGWIAVPEYVDDNTTVSTFCVMKYEAKIPGNDNGQSTGAWSSTTVPESRASGTPWVYLTRDQARTACSNLNGASEDFTYQLLSNAQWQSIARQIERATDPDNPSKYFNWSNQSNSGSNYVNTGHSDSSSNAIAGGTDSDPCAGTGNTNCNNYAHSDFSQKRNHTLPNGEKIWDLGGNVWEWVYDDSIFSYGVGGSWDYIGSSEGSICSAPSCTGPQGSGRDAFGPWGAYPTHAGLGSASLYGTNGAIFRGGAWGDSTSAGIFTANLGYAGTYGTYAHVGYRCSAVPKEN